MTLGNAPGMVTGRMVEITTMGHSAVNAYGNENEQLIRRVGTAGAWAGRNLNDRLGGAVMLRKRFARTRRNNLLNYAQICASLNLDG
jgi:hypothetical protein